MMVGGDKVVMMTVLPRRDKRDWTVGHSEMNTMMTLLIIVIIILIIVITSIILITIIIMRSTPTWGRPLLRHGSSRMRGIPAAKIIL